MLVFFPGASGKENPNFYEICPTVAHGNNGYFSICKFEVSLHFCGEKLAQKNLVSFSSEKVA